MGPYYRSYRQHLKEDFPFRVFKIPIDAGFTCPNIDGTVAYGGCRFCDNKSFSPNSRTPSTPVREQVLTGIDFYRRRFRAEKFIVYFQAFTNTHGPVEQLQRWYDEALDFPDVIGLSIGTRPDCVPGEVLDLLAQYRTRTRLSIEYGLQSIHDRTMDDMNRGHSFLQFLDAVERTKPLGIPICVHVILGLPGETREMMIQTAEAVARLGLHGIKIHHLYISKNTALEKTYREKPFPLLGVEEYVRLVCDVLERLPADMVVERIVGELSPLNVVEPHWGKSKLDMVSLIEHEFDQRGTCQGTRFSESGKGKSA